MMALVVTPLYAGILGGVFAVLSLAVGLTRVGTGVMHGAKEGSTLYNRNRAQATVGDYSPFAILLLALMEYNDLLSAKWLWGWGLIFTVGRCLHAFQLASPTTRPEVLRTASFLTMFLLFVSAAVLNVNFALKQK